MNNAAATTSHSDLVAVFAATGSTGRRVCSEQCSCCWWSCDPVTVFAATCSTGHSVCGDRQHWSQSLRQTIQLLLLVRVTWSQCLWRLAALVAEFVANNAAAAAGQGDLVTVFGVTGSTGRSVCSNQRHWSQSLW